MTLVSPGTPEVPPVITTKRTMKQGHVAALRPLPDPGPEVKRATPGPTARKTISTQPPAPRNSVTDGLRPAPTLDPCLGLAPGPGPGLDGSLGVTDCFLPKLIYLFLFGFQP